MKRIITRDVTMDECTWLDGIIKEGTVVFDYSGYTYGCVSPSGRAVTVEDGKTPFFEIPRDALSEI